ncbi:ester cyclase [Actinoplanes sp. NPDC049599]|uniref:ester cyclase n=1 Tax=Actinoplanes sp. NPDC049599 TaxID=3363903 RepID=UPI00379AEA1C
MRRRSETAAFYRHYLAACNAHAFDRLAEFVAEDVWVNDRPVGLTAYVAGLREVVGAFPDYHWELRSLLIEGDSIAVHFTDTGTHLGPFLGVAPTGRWITTSEFAVYRLREDRIGQVWVATDRLALLEQLR